jgi:epoxide hydrolase
VHSFRIDIPQAEIDRLLHRLDETCWPAPLPGDGWDAGVPVSWLREPAGYWRSRYDWRAAERELNQIPQFTTVIDGQFRRPRRTLHPRR